MRQRCRTKRTVRVRSIDTEKLANMWREAHAQIEDTEYGERLVLRSWESKREDVMYEFESPEELEKWSERTIRKQFELGNFYIYGKNKGVNVTIEHGVMRNGWKDIALMPNGIEISVESENQKSTDRIASNLEEWGLKHIRQPAQATRIWLLTLGVGCTTAAITGASGGMESAGRGVVAFSLVWILGSAIMMMVPIVNKYAQQLRIVRRENTKKKEDQR